MALQIADLTPNHVVGFCVFRWNPQGRPGGSWSSACRWPPKRRLRVALDSPIYKCSCESNRWFWLLHTALLELADRYSFRQPSGHSMDSAGYCRISQIRLFSESVRLTWPRSIIETLACETPRRLPTVHWFNNRDFLAFERIILFLLLITAP